MKRSHMLLNRTVSQTCISIAVAGMIFSCQSAENSKAASTKGAAKQSISAEVSIKDVPPKQVQRKLVVYYLHTTFRCHSCNTIERLTKEAVESGFADQMKSGRIEFKVLNIEESGNEHLVEDYKLYTKSVILSDLKDGKEVTWKNLDKVWTLLGNEAKFVEYIQTEVKSYLEG